MCGVSVCYYHSYICLPVSIQICIYCSGLLWTLSPRGAPLFQKLIAEAGWSLTAKPNAKTLKCGAWAISALEVA